MEGQRNPLSVLAMSCGVALVMTAGSAHAYDGTINFSGQIVSQTCTVVLPGGSAIDVTLPSVSEQSLAESGKTAGAHAFQISLTECEAGQKVRAYFEMGPSVDPETMMLKNTAPAGSAAKNVEVALTDVNGNLIPVGFTQTQAPVTVDTSGNATLTYVAEYYAVDAAAAGGVTSTVNFTIEYL
ncbi:hypothetical protein CAL12_04570 [Bordetella genomosp. 8]|uniref:Fimbrial protein n=1 Tax=Bordetella genomosp. 8 TaxID=1416806 RepID=A0A1W6YGQ1_9BORD|nr:fimbrial protein [Bordetella genomosp. 8]ARP80174.1 hypothetical protein CAL12_04570 [Bordetella genomosp. 8]